jgi:hypothetical protein
MKRGKARRTVAIIDFFIGALLGLSIVVTVLVMVG